MQKSNTLFNQTVLLIALLISIASLVATALIEYFWIYDNIWKRQIVLLLGAIETSSIVIAIWEFSAKKTFAKEILTLANISSNITLSGIEYIYFDFLDINWKSLLKNTKSLKVAVTYANTWRESNRSLLTKFVEEKNTLTVFLPDFTDADIINVLALRFNTNSENVKNKIKESYEQFSKIIGANVFLYRGCFQSSYYLADNVGVMSFFNHKREKSTVPAIQVNNQGELYKYIKSEMEVIENNSYAWKGYADEK